ncbi:hypothetical protein AAFF_G00048990 [Aldrovandia affinis]|uniref:Uncharacterized protein n=1 Tax=Aldrovandia affinis TaxID=143900 RepID=A0AAD7WFJ6_9TELE|nr:hypothetical protein AAFF_G00048990 [Aldrovandia affinis]
MTEWWYTHRQSQHNIWEEPSFHAIQLSRIGARGPVIFLGTDCAGRDVRSESRHFSEDEGGLPRRLHRRREPLALRRAHGIVNSLTVEGSRQRGATGAPPNGPGERRGATRH